MSKIIWICCASQWFNWLKYEWVSMWFLAKLLSYEKSIARPPCSKPVDLPIIDLHSRWRFSPDSMINQWAKCIFNNDIIFDIWSIGLFITWPVIQLPASGLLGRTVDGNTPSVLIISSQQLVGKHDLMPSLELTIMCWKNHSILGSTFSFVILQKPFALESNFWSQGRSTHCSTFSPIDVEYCSVFD